MADSTSYDAQLAEFLQMLADVSTQPDAQALLMQQRQEGQQMAQAPGAQGMNVGGTYRAADPLEHMAVALQRVMGARKAQGAESGYQDSLAKQRAARLAAMQRVQGLDAPPQQAVTEMPEMYIGGASPTEMPPMYIGLDPRRRSPVG